MSDCFHEHNAVNGNNHNHNHDHDTDHDHGFELGKNSGESLWKYIDLDSVQILNEANVGLGKNVLRPFEKRNETTPILESDVDEQLLITIPFTGLIKLFSIVIRTPPGEIAPDEIRVFKNRADSMTDFETAQNDTSPQQVILHPEDNDGKFVEYSVKRAVFSNVRSITLFVQSNHGAPTTQFYYIGFKGQWSKLAKDPVVTMYEAAANPADHMKLVPEEKWVEERN